MLKEPRGYLQLIGKVTFPDNDTGCQKMVSLISDLFQSSLPENWDVESLNRFRVNTHYHFFTLINDDVVIAGALVSTVYETAELLAIAVNENQRRQGHGKKILDFIEQWLHDNSQVDVFILDVASRNISAVDLYNKNEFEIINKREKYYEPHDKDASYDDAIVMRKIIKRT